MLKAEKAAVWQTPYKTLCQAESWLLPHLCDRLPPSQLMAINAVDLDMSCFLPSSYQMPQPFANRCNLFYDFLVRWVQQLQWPSSSLTDVKDSFTQAVLAKSFFIHFASTSLQGRPSMQMSQSDQDKTTSLVKICSTLYIPTKGHQCRCQLVTTVRKRFSSQFSSSASSKIRSMHSVPSQCWWLTKLESGRHLRPCVRKILGSWCCCVTTHFGWGSGCGKNEHSMLQCQDFRTEVWRCPEFQIFVKLQEAFLLQASEWKLLGSSRWGLQQRPIGRCCTAKSKQHLSHEQRMMIRAAWNQRRLLTIQPVDMSNQAPLGISFFACISPEKASWGSVHAGWSLSKSIQTGILNRLLISQVFRHLSHHVYRLYMYVHIPNEFNHRYMHETMYVPRYTLAQAKHKRFFLVKRKTSGSSSCTHYHQPTILCDCVVVSWYPCSIGYQP